MAACRNMSNLDLITAESELDFRDPDIITEIFSRAEDFEPGISEQYVSAFQSCDLCADDIFDRAIGYLKGRVNQS